MKKSTKRLALIGAAYVASILLYKVERSLPVVDQTIRIDLDGDGLIDKVHEEGYSFYPRYTVFIQDSQGRFSENTSFSRKEITSKLDSD